MRKREGMKKRRSRILAWLLACFMVLSVIQGTGWGSFTVQAEESNEEENENTEEKVYRRSCCYLKKADKARKLFLTEN